MKFAFDLDGTLVEQMSSEFIFEAKPIQEMINFSNKLYDEGHTIYIYTARGMKKLKGQAHLIPSEYYEKTKLQLDNLGIKYTSIVFGKLDYDFLICNQAYNNNDIKSLTRLLEKKS